MMSEEESNDGDVFYSYVDDNGAVQGPFALADMRAWLADGYFAPSRPVARLAAQSAALPATDAHVAIGSLAEFARDDRPAAEADADADGEHGSARQAAGNGDDTIKDNDESNSDEGNTDEDKNDEDNNDEGDNDKGDNAGHASTADNEKGELAQLQPLMLNGVVVPPPPGWRGVPIASDEATVAATEQFYARAEEQQRLLREQAAGDGGAELRKWSDAEYEHWALLAEQHRDNPSALPTDVWKQLDLERRERQRIEALAQKYIVEHQTKRPKRKKYSWS